MASFNINSFLNSQNTGNEQLISKVHYTKLIKDENNPYSITDIQELADSIINFGLLSNLVVKDQGDGNFKIVSGHRRYEAIKYINETLKKDGFEEVRCLVSNKSENDIITRIKLHIANTTQRVLTPSEQMLAIAELNELYDKAQLAGFNLKGKRKDIIADSLNISDRQAQKYITIQKNANKEELKKLETGKITLEKLYNQVKDRKELSEVSKARKSLLLITKVENEMKEFNDSSINRLLNDLKNKINTYLE